MTDEQEVRELIRLQGVAFESLKDSVAWTAMRDWLAAEVERAKGAVILSEPGTPLRTLRDRFTAWQEREKVLMGLTDIIDEEITKYREMLEVEQDERNSRSTIDRSKW